MSEVKAAKTLNVRGSASKSCSNAIAPLARRTGPQRCARRHSPPQRRPGSRWTPPRGQATRPRLGRRARAKNPNSKPSRAQTQNHAGLRQRLRAQRRGPGLRAELRAAARAARRAELSREEPPYIRALVAQTHGDGQRIQALFADRDQKGTSGHPRVAAATDTIPTHRAEA